MTDHADLIARAEAYARPEPGMPKDSPNYDLVRQLVAALADSVPRERHDDLLGVARLAQSAFASAQRERDEARTERDTLARVIDQAPHGRGCTRMEQATFVGRADFCDCWKKEL